MLQKIVADAAFAMGLCDVTISPRHVQTEVVAELERHQEQVGRPPPGEELVASDPRRVLAEAVTYLRNNAGRMDYPRYRRGGPADDE